MLIFLALSFLSTNGMHAYLLMNQKDKDKITISHNAALNNRNYTIFIIGHFLGGLFFLIFGYQFFVIELQSDLLFNLLVAGVIFEQFQAVIPERNGYEKLHTALASLMAVFIALILILSPFIITLTPLSLALYIFGIIFSLGAGVYGVLNYEKFYITQMIFFSMFYIMILILYFGRV